MKAIVIDVQSNTLICGANGGNAYLSPGDRIRWKSADRRLPFTLEFFRLGLEADGECIEVSSLDRWPFADPPEPKRGIVGPTTEFKATLKKKGGAAFKYTVTVGNLRLDPIIIVDRH